MTREEIKSLMPETMGNAYATHDEFFRRRGRDDFFMTEFRECAEISQSIQIVVHMRGKVKGMSMAA